MKKNQSVDLLHGPIFKSLSLLAIPIMATYFIQMAYNLVDMLWIGFLGSGAVASIGVSGNFMYLSNGLVNMPKKLWLDKVLELIIKNKQKIIFRQLFKVPYFLPLYMGLLLLFFKSI